jgi:hypothetical protein
VQVADGGDEAVVAVGRTGAEMGAAELGEGTSWGRQRRDGGEAVLQL